jgi:hypothetical protein
MLIASASATVTAAWRNASSQETAQRQLAAVTAPALDAAVGTERRAQGISINELAQARNSA